eukprot:204452-Amphidinium_carterae.1
MWGMAANIQTLEKAGWMVDEIIYQAEDSVVFHSSSPGPNAFQAKQGSLVSAVHIKAVNEAARNALKATTTMSSAAAAASSAVAPLR